MNDEKSRACASCKGTHLVKGRLTSQYYLYFLPAGKWFWGYTPKAYSCLDCGFVGMYLIQRDVETLKEKERHKSE